MENALDWTLLHLHTVCGRYRERKLLQVSFYYIYSALFVNSGLYGFSLTAIALGTFLLFVVAVRRQTLLETIAREITFYQFNLH